MKTCPLCSDTYSERIDFCFNDGEVLALQPSAMDAPIPRFASVPPVRTAVRPTRPPEREASASAAVDAPTSEELAERSAVTEELPRVPVVPHPVELPAVPPVALPAASHGATASGPRSEPAVPRPPPPPAGSAGRIAEPVPPPRPPETRPTERIEPVRPTPKVVAPVEPSSRFSWVPWFVGALVAALAVVMFVWRIGDSEGAADDVPKVVVPSGTSPPAPTPAGTPTPAVAPAPAPPADLGAAPVGAPSTVTGGADPTSTAPAPAAPSPPIAPATPVPAAPSRPSTPLTPPREEPRVTAPPAPTPTPEGGSPWDAPEAIAQGRALISSHPSGARVRLDGKDKGVTPLEITLPYGSYSVELDLDGFVPVRRRIDVQSAEPKFPNTLDPMVRRGNVMVVFEGWDGAALSIDGEVRGVLPVTVMLSEGMHNFVVKGDRGEVRLKREVRLVESGLTRLLLHQ